jgi:hypothetical protein
MPKTDKAGFRKDKSLNTLAESINVAQFVSFSPSKPIGQEYARVLGYAPNYRFRDLRLALETLIARSSEHSVNVRSFKPSDLRSNEFLYGLTRVDQVESAVRRLCDSGMYVIVNETIDVRDGGVSGVVQGETIEFSPDDTPRCVEKPGVASLPRPWGIGILRKMYGPLDFRVGSEFRLEFSVHPKPRGWKATHLLGWELEKIGKTSIKPSLKWPNNFSRLIGDKTFGLLIADQVGLPVPRTTVINRRVAPFSFGKRTGRKEFWIRTAPTEQVPGKFTTHRGWLDPFTLLAKEDPTGERIASVLAQESVTPSYSGALIVGADNSQIIEGRHGAGEEFMQGTAPPEVLPTKIRNDVKRLYMRAARRLGAVRFEWVHDGKQPWIVQLHRGMTTSTDSVIVPGEANQWRSFEVSRGLEELRTELESLIEGQGLVLKGQVGLTSHIADVIRKAGRPARISA